MWNETIDPNARSYLRVVTASGTAYSDYDGSLDIQSAVFSSATCSSSSISVGSVNVAQVLFTYTGAITLLNQAITVQYSQNGQTWYNVGVFTIVDSATSNGVTTATGYDALYWWGDTVPTTRQTSAQAALQWLCSSSGVELETLPTPDITIDYDFAGCSYSMALGYLCALWGRNALINRNGKLELVLKKTSSTIPDLSDAVYSGQDSTQSGDYVVAKLVNTVDDTTTTRANTLTGQTITLTNPLLNETTIDRTWAQVNGLRYRGGAWTLFGWQQLEAGDVVTVNDNQTICLQLTKVYDGGWKTTLTAPAELPAPVSSTVATARAAAAQAIQAQETAIQAQAVAIQAEEVALRAQETADNAQTAATEAAKTATNYINFDAIDGLVVGDMTSGSLGGNTQILSDGMNIRYGSTVLASYKASEISFGVNSTSSVVKLCGGASRIWADDEGNASLGNYSGKSTTVSCYRSANDMAGFVQAGASRTVVFHDEVILLSSPRYSVSNPDEFRSAISAAPASHTHSYQTPLTTHTIELALDSVSAGNTRSGSVNASKAGYTALGVVGWQMGTSTGNSLFAVSRLYISGNQLYYLVRNTGTATYSATLTATVLYG